MRRVPEFLSSFDAELTVIGAQGQTPHPSVRTWEAGCREDEFTGMGRHDTKMAPELCLENDALKL